MINQEFINWLKEQMALAEASRHETNSELAKATRTTNWHTLGLVLLKYEQLSAETESHESEGI